MAKNDKVKVAVVGASGYSGIEAVRLLSGHPFAELTGLPPSITPDAKSPTFSAIWRASICRHSRIAPRPASRAAPKSPFHACPRLRTAHTADLVKAGIKVVDLSADFRLKDPAQYRATYGADHPAPHLLKEAVYGLSEFHRNDLREARLTATPGCYPTGALLAILPLIRRDLIEPSSIIIDAKSGTTGARRAASIDQLFAEVNENFRAYKVGNHRHVPEMEQEISAALGRDIALLFVPHLLPITRGLLSSIFMRPRAGTTESDVHAAFEASFAKSRFVRILKPGELPELRNVRATNYCELAFILDRRSETLLVLTAIDNLGKGAAGQAVQNMNLMLGYDEAAGLLNAAPVP